jgi:hypothetical protein
MDTISAPIQSLRVSSDVVIGLVIRQGSYRRWLEGKFYFDVPTYIRWMRQSRELFPEKRVGFFICSDEKLDVAEFSDFHFIFRDGHDLENRYSLSLCDYLLCVPSTFGGWAAFYGKVPMCVLGNAEQDISLEGFKPINNHLDLRDRTFPQDTDVTTILISR